MKRLALVAGLLLVLLTSAFAEGNFMQAKIPFDFVVNGKAFPAGTYDFATTPNNQILITNHDNGKRVQLSYQTRLAADKKNESAGISFDVQGGQHFIEAIWPGHQDDGYLLHSVKGTHTHEMVSSK